MSNTNRTRVSRRTAMKGLAAMVAAVVVAPAIGVELHADRVRRVAGRLSADMDAANALDGAQSWAQMSRAFETNYRAAQDAYGDREGWVVFRDAFDLWLASISRGTA